MDKPDLDRRLKQAQRTDFAVYGVLYTVLAGLFLHSIIVSNIPSILLFFTMLAVLVLVLTFYTYRSHTALDSGVLIPLLQETFPGSSFTPSGDMPDNEITELMPLNILSPGRWTRVIEGTVNGCAFQAGRVSISTGRRSHYHGLWIIAQTGFDVPGTARMTERSPFGATMSFSRGKAASGTGDELIDSAYKFKGDKAPLSRLTACSALTKIICELGGQMLLQDGVAHITFPIEGDYLRTGLLDENAEAVHERFRKQLNTLKALLEILARAE